MLTQTIVESKSKDDPNNMAGEKYILKLFVAGISPNSKHAITNTRAICEKHLKGRYELEIVDIYQQPTLALAEEIIAIPVLIRKFPLPEERLIGDLSDTAMVIKELDLTSDSNGK
jgi:circadian clock protein KaiB